MITLKPNNLTLMFAVFALAAVGRAETITPTAGGIGGEILDMGPGAEKRVTPTSGQVKVDRSTDAAAPGLKITIDPGPEGYPGVKLQPGGAEGNVWDLSKWGHVEAKVTNLGEKPLRFAIRVDNPGKWQDNPWNTEMLSIKPGATGTLKLIFGYQYGGKPGFALKPETVSNILLFTSKSDAPQVFRIESLFAAGPPGEKPAIDPNSIRIAPKDGYLLGGPAVPTAPGAYQITARGAQGALEEGGLKITFPAAKTEQMAALRLAQGRYDLRQYLEVHVVVKNTGTVPLTPRIRVDSNGGQGDAFATAAPLAPGAEAEIVAPFTNGVPIDINNKETQKRVSSNTVSGVIIATDAGDVERSVLVKSIRAVLPPSPVLPAWVGKKPPAEGDWVQTFGEEFNGAEVDQKKWNIYTSNFWDKRSHFSKDNTFLKNGIATLRMEKKRGHDWDDPARPETDYATGFLDTYGKWTQRYGYFEARMKLPTAPGLWPAFWTMPDRGVAAGPEQWKRADTKNGGMEFDILEHLTGWGNMRYNIAHHWDGYGKDHKANGTSSVYVQPDKDGFITTGVLWTPGSLIYYAQGKEVVRWENERISNVPADLILYMVTGGWDNLPLDDAQLPADFQIDWVRCWQRKDLASDVDMNKLPVDPIK